MSQVYSRWHDFIEAYNAGRTLTGVFKGRLSWRNADTDKGVTDTMIDLFTNAPHYVFTNETVEIIQSKQTDKSLDALIQMDQDRLPHPTVVAEFSASGSELGKQLRFFVMLTERRNLPIFKEEFVYHPIIATIFSLYTPDDGPYMGQTFACMYPFQIMVKLLRPGAKTADKQTYDVVSMHYQVVDAPWFTGSIKELSEAVSLVTKHLKEQTAVALRGLIMMMHMRGIERDPVTVPKLNKSRLKRNKPRIRDHIVVRLGYYMTSTGERKRYDPTKQRGIRGMWIMPTHYRNQRYGKGLSETKRIKIDGWIANFDPNKELPKPKLKVVKP